MKRLIVGAAALLLLSAGSAFAAGTNLNEVGSVLIYPGIFTFGCDNPVNVETFVTITNAGGDPVNVHMSYINGKQGPDYCFECNFDVPLTGYDTEVLVITHDEFGIEVRGLDSGESWSCDYKMGFLVAVNETPVEDGHPMTSTGNVLLGEQVVVNYSKGRAYSIPAISFQGTSGNGDRKIDFDNSEYSKFPRYVATSFMAPNDPDYDGPFTADLILLTPNFETQYPPETHCEFNAFDAEENSWSNSFFFGCWTMKSLCDISSEFCYPLLGSTNNQEHGWMHLNCDVDGALGGVHGAILQLVDGGVMLRRESPQGPHMSNPAAWGRLLFQSVTAGDSVTLETHDPYGGMQ